MVGKSDINDSIYLSLTLCLLNTVTYPVFLMLLSIKTPFVTPIVKDLAYENYQHLGKQEYVFFECKKLLKYNIPFFLLLFAPFIVNCFINGNILKGLGMIEIFTLVGFANLLPLQIGLSSIMKNFYQKYYWAYFLILSNLFLYSFLLMPNETRYLLYLSIFLNIACFLTGLFLSIKRRKRDKLIEQNGRE
jgi:hypothetical protein